MADNATVVSAAGGAALALALAPALGADVLPRIRILWCTVQVRWLRCGLIELLAACCVSSASLV
ncbi:hypothetical protein PR002_g9075 [Phytophthora rubi]|uniref:Uncharacterized protein n=1 Tax=Phytophthora rubi TaxID=129364 RepID=A0A6A3MTR3_9STRA|nr:hypothetical protein PR002_g9075 [Phytophthora rubi]